MDGDRIARGDEPVAARARPAEVLSIASCAALLASLIYVARWGYVWFVREEVVGVSRDVAWFAPLATLMIWFAAALPVLLLARFVPRRFALWLSGFGFFAMTALSALLPVGALSRLSVGILALGVGAAAARTVVERRGAIVFAQRTALTSALVLAIAAVSIAVGSSQGRRAAVGAAPRGAPNVLLIVMDAARADALSMSGSARPTSPHLDQLAREGTHFAHAVATASWTRPSHRSMFTGDYPIRAPEARSTFLARATNDSVPMLAEFFRAHGYETGAFVANFYYTGWDAGFTRGFGVYRDFPRTLEQILRTSTLGQTKFARSLYVAEGLGDVWRAVVDNDLTVPARPANSKKEAAAVTDELLAWRARRPEKPFFAFLNYYDAHLPYAPPPPYDRMFNDGAEPRDKYDGSIAYIDAEIGRLIEGLRARGELDRTVVVITSDHGELFGEHGLFEHTSNLYYKLLHVPLIVRWPAQVPAGLRVETEASLRDLPATLAQLAVPNEAAPFAGASLAPLWSGDATVRSAALSLVEQGVRRDSTLPFARGDMVSLADSVWHFVRNNGTGKEELYRYRDDPSELDDRVDDPAAAVPLTRLRSQARAMVSQAQGSAGTVASEAPSRRAGRESPSRRAAPLDARVARGRSPAPDTP